MHARHVATPAAVADLAIPELLGPCRLCDGPSSWAGTLPAGAVAFSVAQLFLLWN
jgi:hypothetical protein